MIIKPIHGGRFQVDVSSKKTVHALKVAIQGVGCAYTISRGKFALMDECACRFYGFVCACGLYVCACLYSCLLCACVLVCSVLFCTCLRECAFVEYARAHVCVCVCVCVRACMCALICVHNAYHVYHTVCLTIVVHLLQITNTP